jgi:pSer/pThr/pTyr-binding forkhead associated (FHA) protein
MEMPTLPVSPVAPHSSTPAELQSRLEVERRGVPFLVYRDVNGDQVIRTIAPGERTVTIGRNAGLAVRLDFDEQVSRVHAELECIGDEWTIADDGLSRNGTFVDGERIHGRRRLHDGALIAIGRTVLLFRGPAGELGATETATGIPASAAVSAADRCVLVALCRPLRDTLGAVPATNQQIADELFLSVDAVKTHMRALFGKFGVEDLPQNQKRVRLVELALKNGIITLREL